MIRRLAVLIAFVGGAAGAQTSRSDPTDVQSWYGASLELDLPKRLEAAVDYRLRMVDDASQYRGSYVTGQLGLGVAKWASLFASYRFADVRDDGVNHRFGLGAVAERKQWGTTVSFRTQLQHRLAGPDDEEGDGRTMLRTRLQLKRPLSKAFDVYASTEPYFDAGARYAMDNWRNTVGVKYEYARGRKLDLFYVYRPDYAKAYARTFHVVGVNLDFGARIGAAKR